MKTLALAIATIFALNTGIAFATQPSTSPKAPAAKSNLAEKKKPPKKDKDAKKTPAPAPASTPAKK